MDNKENRKFYWEVKNFVGKKHEHVEPQNVKKTSLLENVKNVLSRNEIYRTSAFNSNITSSDSISQAINAISKSEKSGNPNTLAHSKNIHTNAFRMLRETSNYPGSSHQLPDGTWVDDQGNPIPGAPTPSSSGSGSAGGGGGPPGGGSGSGGSTSAPMSGGSTPAGGGSDVETPEERRARLIANLRRAGGTYVPISGTEKERRDAERARTEAMRDANIDINTEREALRSETRTSMDNLARAREAMYRYAGTADEEKYKQAYEKAAEENRKAMQTGREFYDKTARGQPQFGNSSQANIALRYRAKAEENALPYGDRPISPFYKMTRNQFKQSTGRDYDESGGASTENMRTLVNYQTNLPGRLKDIDRLSQDQAVDNVTQEVYEKHKDLFGRARRGDQAAADEFFAILNAEKEKARRNNPIRNWKTSDFDVAPIQNPDANSKNPAWKSGALTTDVYTNHPKI